MGTVAWLCGATGAAADDTDNKIDCGQTSFAFEGPDYDVTCRDLSKAMMVVQSDAVGARKTQQLFAYSVNSGTFLVAVDNRILGDDRIYLARQSLQSNVENYFSNTSFSHWAAETAVTGFDAAEFDGGPKDEPSMSCIAFRREVSRHREGLRRVVVGLACTTGERSQAYDALKLLKAPGS